MNVARSLALKLATVRQLGILSVLRVVRYRGAMKLGIHPVQHIPERTVKGPFFSEANGQDLGDAKCEKKIVCFGQVEIDLEGPRPDWNSNIFSKEKTRENSKPWWTYSDFDPEVGDIKLHWELSRMAWIPPLAHAARRGDTNALQQLNDWLSHWCLTNPAYRGRQWKCGQEASIRILNCCVALLILEQERSATPGLLDFFEIHLSRIAPTVSYAKGQNNNHGTSEAAAMYMAGLVLTANGRSVGSTYYKKGRAALEERTQLLFNSSGGFSQYSTNYHRMALDTLSLVEAFRRTMEAPKFSDGFYARASAAARWLFDRVVATNGEAPNMGANDSSYILFAPGSFARDFRPSVQLAMSIFTKSRAYSNVGAWNEPLRLLRIKPAEKIADASRAAHDFEGGTTTCVNGTAFMLFRFPKFTFRPSQSDVFHVDLWLGNENLFRDGGTFSYNCDKSTYEYFRGVASHNTVQFDEHDQMPSLSRFLFGAWLKCKIRDQSFSYIDWWGAKHERKASLSKQCLEVVDVVAGFKREACLRWHIPNEDWHFEILSSRSVCVRRKFTSPVKITIESSADIKVDLIVGHESIHYMQQVPIKVLEVRVREPATLKTTAVWDA